MGYFVLWFDHFLDSWAEIHKKIVVVFWKFKTQKSNSEINWPLECWCNQDKVQPFFEAKQLFMYLLDEIKYETSFLIDAKPKQNTSFIFVYDLSVWFWQWKFCWFVFWEWMNYQFFYLWLGMPSIYYYNY